MKSSRIVPALELPPLGPAPSDAAAARVSTKRTLSGSLTRTWSKLELPSISLAGRYSVAKFVALQDFIARATPWRKAWILLSTPLPAFAAALLPAFLPLRAPRDGPTWSFHVHAWFIVFVVSTGNMVSWTAVTQIPKRVYTTTDAVATGLCCATLQLCGAALLWHLIGFPVPFMWVTCFGLWASNLVLSNMLVLRHRCVRDRAIWLASAKQYLACWAVQMAQITVYPTVSIVYDRVSEPYQIVLTLLFPVLKFGMKHLLKRLARSVRDHSAEVPVSAVEICGSVYQSMVMQTAPSETTIALLMALDCVQGIFSIKLLMDRPTAVPRRDVLRVAHKAARSMRMSQRLSANNLASVVAGNSARRSVRGSFDAQEGPRPVGLPTEADVKRSLVHHALQLAHTTEGILLVEYFEVVIPLVNLAFLSIATRLDSAQYNFKLSGFHRDPRELWSVGHSIILYALLQCVSVVAVHVVMKYRYGIAATSHLAFVLEHHRASIVGKMVAWLPVILHFTSMHYGTDFTFKFKYDDVE